MAARALSGRRRDPGRTPAGNRALRRPRRDARRSTPATERGSPAHSAAAAARVACEPPRPATAEVVLVMGIPGAGKSRVAERVRRPRLRPSQPRRARRVACASSPSALDERLSSGARRVVLDNTYLTRASRSYVIEAASRHRRRDAMRLARHAARSGAGQSRRAPARASRLAADARGAARARTAEPGVLAPTSQMRALRELEPPSTDEGLAGIEPVPFARVPPSANAGERASSSQPLRCGIRAGPTPWRRASGVRRTSSSTGGPTAPSRTSPSASRVVSAEVTGPVVAALCPHAAGAPACWCRPPLPGLPLAFARAHGVDPSRSILVGAAACTPDARGDARRALPRGVSLPRTVGDPARFRLLRPASSPQPGRRASRPPRPEPGG